jgi:hypothetical protein
VIVSVAAAISVDSLFPCVAAGVVAPDFDGEAESGGELAEGVEREGDELEDWALEVPESDDFDSEVDELVVGGVLLMLETEEVMASPLNSFCCVNAPWGKVCSIGASLRA